MPRPKKTSTEEFRRSQVVSPVPSQRRYGRPPKVKKKNFDIYVSNFETGDETLAITVVAMNKRDAIQAGKKLLKSSPLMRDITYAAYTAVEVEE